MAEKNRQDTWQKRMIADGRCRRCGKKRTKSKSLCPRCLILDREAQRKRLGYRSWKRSGLGRPPLEARKSRAA